MPFEPVGPPCRRCLQPPIKVTEECAVCGYPSSPPNFIIVYQNRYRRRAENAFKADAARLAQVGYLPIPRSARWEAGDQYEGRRAAARFLFGYLEALVPPVGGFSMTYRRSDLTPEEALARPADAMRWSS